ncbi:translation initiation factor IF-2 [Methylobacterium sp. JK268]
MIKRSLATAAVFSVGLASVAHAGLIMSPSVSAAPGVALVQPAPMAAQTAPVRSATRYAEVRTLAPLTQTDASERPAPRVIDLPRADTSSQSYVTAPRPALISIQPQQLAQAAPAPEVQPAISEAVPAPAPAPAPSRVEAPRREVVQAPPTVRNPVRPVGRRSAQWKGGGGSTWKTGKNAYGFEGKFGGCHFSGLSGPHGFKLDRACR